MSKLIAMLPIEPFLDERYSLQWLQWHVRDLEASGRQYIVFGDTSPRTITTGQFLDVYDTIEYKAKQIADLIAWIRCHPRTPLTVYVHDLWFPGLEGVAYVRDLTGADITICGWLHAGTWDREDLLSQRGLARWARSIESGWLKLIDKLFLSCRFHRDLLIQTFGQECLPNIVIRSLPCIDRPTLPAVTDRQPVVVWPHRIAPEKQPEVFDVIRRMYEARYGDGLRWERSRDVRRSKDEYHRSLATAMVVLSTGVQETFGISMIEGVAMGCIPVAPDALAYRETLAEFPRYSTLEEAVELIHRAVSCWTLPPYRYSSNLSDVINAIP